MNITLKRLNEHYLMEAANESGNSIRMDAGPGIGGQGLAPRPMEVMIMAMGGCSTIDIISILKKGRQPVGQVEVKLTAEREAGKEPSLFKTIHAHYLIHGSVDPTQAKRAVDLSLEKYCSVAKTLEKTATITWSFEVMTS